MKQVFATTWVTGFSQSGNIMLALTEPQSGKYIPIIVGPNEANAIQRAANGVKARRPMTHDLLISIMQDCALQLQQVTIDRVHEGIFFATLHISDGVNLHTIDARTSDAVVLALQQDVPIMVNEQVLQEVGVSSPTPANHSQGIEKPTLEQLHDELRRCEETEDYERAAEIQKQIDHYFDE